MNMVSTKERARRTAKIAGALSTAEIKAEMIARAFSTAEIHYASMKEELEKNHYGSYVMINVDTLEYVVAQTASMVHAKFIEKYGEDQHGWCTRIGVSAFATA